MKSFKDGKLWIRSIIIGLCSFLVCSILYFAGVFSFYENKTYDQRMIFASKYVKASDDIYFIEIDQQSIDWALETYGWTWPWPREAYTKMIEFFTNADVNSIAFDIIFSEPSIYGPEDDQALADSAKESELVIFGQFVPKKGKTPVAQEPIPVIRESAAILGNTNSLMDEDDIIRRGRLEYVYNDTVYPTLGTAPLYLEGRKEEVDNIPRLKDGSVLLRYQRNMDAYFPYRASDIFASYDAILAGEEPEYSYDDFEDCYIFVAYYATGLFDFCSTPVSQVFPGVGIHITTLDNLLNNQFMIKVKDSVSCLWLFFITLLAVFFVALATTRHSQKATVFYMISGFFIGLSFTIGVSYLLFAQGYWLPLVAPVFTFLLSFILCVGLSLTLEGKQKRFIKAAFSQCLSEDVVNQIMNDPSSFTLGGEKYDMTAIFTDIEKFSSFSELMSAPELGSFLNYYLTEMSDILIEERATIDKYEGDAIVALVGAPLRMEDHAKRACAAALKMKKAEILMNKEIEETANKPRTEKMEESLYNAFKIMIQNKKRVFTRIGINSGEMIAGYFGSTNKKNYTMMGNNVNLASRLEGVNKQYKTNGILISEATRERLGQDFIVRSLDRVRVVNVNTPLRLYELLETKEEASQELLDYVNKWEKAISDFENQDYKEASKQIKKLLKTNPEDRVAQYYLDLLEDYFLKGKYPTEADSAGVAYNPEDKVFKLLRK